MNQVKITFPTPLSVESWKLILDMKPIVEIWSEETRKQYATKWSGTKINEPVEMWFDMPDFLELTIKSDTKRTQP